MAVFEIGSKVFYANRGSESGVGMCIVPAEVVGMYPMSYKIRMSDSGSIVVLRDSAKPHRLFATEEEAYNWIVQVCHARVSKAKGALNARQLALEAWELKRVSYMDKTYPKLPVS